MIIEIASVDSPSFVDQVDRPQRGETTPDSLGCRVTAASQGGRIEPPPCLGIPTILKRWSQGIGYRSMLNGTEPCVVGL